MIRNALSGWGLVLALGVVAGPSAAMAAVMPKISVEQSARVPAQPARLDVRAVCPRLDEQLGRALAAPLAHFRRPGLAEVRMRVEQGRNVEVLSVDGPRVYQRWLKRAVSALSCEADGGATEFAFGVRFVRGGVGG